MMALKTVLQVTERLLNTKVKFKHIRPYYFIWRPLPEADCRGDFDKHSWRIRGLHLRQNPLRFKLKVGPAVAPTSSARGLMKSSFLLAFRALAIFLVM